MTAIGRNATFIRSINRIYQPHAVFVILQLAALCEVILPCRAIAQGSLEDYRRWESFTKRTANRVYRQNIKPNWIGDTHDSFWYRVQLGSNAHQFILVDTGAKRRQVAFDHNALAKELEAHDSEKVNADRMDLRSLTFNNERTRCQFRFRGKAWSFSLPTGPLERLTKADSGEAESLGIEPETTVVKSINSAQQANIVFDNRTNQPLRLFWVDPQGKRHGYGMVNASAKRESNSYVGHAWVLLDPSDKPAAAFVVDAWKKRAVINQNTPRPQPLVKRRVRRQSREISPDKKWTVKFDDHNVTLVQNETSDRRTLTDDGSENDSYGGRVWWSPDSRHFAVMKTRQTQKRQISMVESAPEDSIHGKLKTISYAKPGDDLDIARVALFHTDGDSPGLIDASSFSNPFGLTDFAWHKNSQSFSFVYNQRGHQVLRLVRVDAQTAKPYTIIDETSETFVCYSHKKFLHRLDDTDELIWMSERSGWNHLYLVDQISGDVKHAITQGDWVVRGIEKVDERRRQIWLRASGIDPDEDPYHVHLVRVDMDGQNFVRLTRGDGEHQWSFSPDRRFLIDTYSRVDLPPVTQLMNADTGEFICELERADDSALIDTGWQYPERFVAKGRDGKTDIHGVIVRPTNFDPEKRYPILEDIYAGPHSAFVPKRFGIQRRMFEMAELGFIVVKIDGMGTSHRSKDFHDVCWQNLGDSGFPDRVAWIKSAAAKHPEMDLSRVGLWGGSAGGQSAMRALITHGDFYKAAVADCGCHDNRVDKIWWNEQWMGWPVGPHYVQQSNVTQAHRLKGDLMLIWGELDTNVDPVSTVQVIDALIKADKDFEQLIMPGVGHGAAGHPYAKRRQADFFVRKLWGREPRHQE